MQTAQPERQMSVLSVLGLVKCQYYLFLDWQHVCSTCPWAHKTSVLPVLVWQNVCSIWPWTGKMAVLLVLGLVTMNSLHPKRSAELTNCEPEWQKKIIFYCKINNSINNNNIPTPLTAVIKKKSLSLKKARTIFFASVYLSLYVFCWDAPCSNGMLR